MKKITTTICRAIRKAIRENVGRYMIDVGTRYTNVDGTGELTANAKLWPEGSDLFDFAVLESLRGEEIPAGGYAMDIYCYEQIPGVGRGDLMDHAWVVIDADGTVTAKEA